MEAFWIKLGLSFLVSGLYITATTRLSEQLGSKVGGMLTGLPSVVLVGLVFIAWTQGAGDLVAATTVMPATIAISTIFLVVFMLLHRLGVIAAYFGALALWFAITVPLVVLNVNRLQWSLPLALVLFSISLSFFRRQPHRRLGAVFLSRQAFLFRALFAGAVVSLAVLCAKLLGPLWGGLFASFPAAFSSTLLILERAHGIDFAASVARTMVSGALANVVFVVGIYFLVPEWGILVGMVSAYLTCLLFALAWYRFALERV